MVLESVTAAYMGATVRAAERGQTLVEYGLIVGLIAVAAIAGVSLMAGEVDSLWGWIGDSTSNAVNSVTD